MQKVAFLIIAILTGIVSFCCGRISVANSFDYTTIWDDCYTFNNQLNTLLNESKSVCFIGDSITAGSENGGYPWYLPLVNKYPNLETQNISCGGATTTTILKLFDKNPIASNVYIIAIGTNDIRYRDKTKGAYTKEEYINNLEKLISAIKKVSPDCKFVFIAPWCSIPDDPIPPITREKKDYLANEYTLALSSWCNIQGHMFINPNSIISFIINDTTLRTDYLIDHIHPNKDKGIYFYSSAVYQNAL